MDHFIYKIDNISKRFGDLQVLKNINLEIQSGSVVVCIGANGAGKSTCFKILSGLLKPDSGSFYIKTKEVMKPLDNKMIGYCPQDIAIWPDLTCREQMTMVAQLNRVKAEKSKQRVNELLKSLQLASKADVLASKLSGGMKRRLNMGLALVHEPALCILDEPLDGVDLRGRKFIRDYIKNISFMKKQTIIISTHIIEEALALNGIIVLFKEGKLIVFDSPDDFYRSNGNGILDSLYMETAS